MNSLAKIYDSLIHERLKSWHTLLREQAGAQKGRGCIELIVTLRLIFQYAIKSKSKLYVVFVDYSAAYDRVPRNKLIQTLRDFGCPNKLLSAIAAIYRQSYLSLNDDQILINQ